MISVKKLLYKVINCINSRAMLLHKYEFGDTITANSDKTISVTITYSGYKPIGIVGFSTPSWADIKAVAIQYGYGLPYGTAIITVHNNTGTDKTIDDGVFDIDVLYVSDAVATDYISA